MLKRTLRRLTQGERKFAYPGESPLGATGGLPFYGNLYVGRVHEEDYRPPGQGGSAPNFLSKNHAGALWENPAVRQKIQECPYFALCDQVLYHNMDPAYLDPGLLTPEEHQLLLLYSRAYYEKWKAIHRRPANGVTRIRIRYGSSDLLDRMCNYLDVPGKVRDVLKREYLVDDSCLIAMNPDVWSTAYFDPANLDHLSGRVLGFADMAEETQEKFFALLHQMRRLHIVRKDLSGAAEEHFVVPYKEATTLYDLSKSLNIIPYAGQLKVYNMVDLRGTVQTVTLSDEDAFFDFLVTSFYKADLHRATLGELADSSDYTTQYTITVEPYTAAERRVGRWF